MEPEKPPAMLEGRFGENPDYSWMLPTKYYTEPSIFEREKQAIFFKGWQFAGHVDEFDGTGSYSIFEFFDQSIILIRCADGQIRGFHNVCMHRGHQLLKGTGVVKRIVCPYHAWSYDIDGSLVAAGNSENVTGFNPEEICLTAVRVEEFARMIFVNFDREAKSMKQTMAGLDDEFRAAIPGYDSLIRVRRDPFEVQANWKVVIENFAECYHCPIAHDPVMTGSNSLLKKSFETAEHPRYMSHIIRANSHENPSYNFHPDDAVQDVFLWWMWPNIMFMSHPAGANFHIFNLIPLGPDRTAQTIDFYSYSKTPAKGDWEMFEFNADSIANEDVALCESVQRGLHSQGYKPGRLMIDKERTYASEHCLHHFQRLVWDALNRDAAPS